MSLFKKQPMVCCMCGQRFMSDFNLYGGCVCSLDCLEEFQWRKTLYIMGKTYEIRQIKD
jgi:hypothetical protein